MLTTGTLTKARTVEAIVEINWYTQQNAHETIEILHELIKQSLESGEDIMISGFGKLNLL